MARASSRLSEALQSFSSARKKTPTSTNQQAESLLFNLPYELRQKIWSLAVAPRNPSPHFHIYDTIYDSCTYVNLDKWREIRRRDPWQIGLLLTCQAAYVEAVQFLYEDTEFNLILFAGRPRPAGDLKGRNCLGRIGECEKWFRRMRKVTIVIQAGGNPNVAKYAARLAELLGVLNNCEDVKDLCLLFNLHAEFLGHKDGPKRFEAIVDAFYPLENRKEGLLIRTLAIWGESYNYLLASLPGAKTKPWDYTETKDICMCRGRYGSPENWANRSAMSRRATTREIVFAVTIGAAYLAFLPVSVVMSLWLATRRKIDKGEW